jgi:GT2 family glycosyltransferase
MDLTVIIPTRDRLEALRGTLSSLAAQRLGEIEVEVVVVDNGSDDGTCAWVLGRAATFPFPLRLVEERTRGVSAARNRAVAEAKGRLILSINDDTAPITPDLVAGHVQQHIALADTVAVLGRISYPPDQMSADPFLAWLNDDAQFAFGRLKRGEPPLPNHYYTAHLSFRRDVFEAVGAMDERLEFGFEDAELGVRMSAAGIRLVYRSDLVLCHDHPITVTEWRRRAERMGAAGWLVNQLHPTDPPIAQPACGRYWRTLELGDRVLAKLPTTWRWLHPSLRDAIYTIVNQGSYTRGYLDAARSPA